MAKPIVVSFTGSESSFDLAKVERAKLYGARKRVPLDANGQPCVRSSLTLDGLYLLQSGMTAQGYFDESGRWLQKSQLVGIGDDGEILDLKPSTLGVAQTLESIEPGTVLNHSIDAVYLLDPITLDPGLQTSLDAGRVFRFGFNYGADYHLETAFLLKNDEGYFCLVGVPFQVEWSEAGKVSINETQDEVEEELDFDMF